MQYAKIWTAASIRALRLQQTPKVRQRLSGFIVSLGPSLFFIKSVYHNYRSIVEPGLEELRHTKLHLIAK